MKIDITDDVKFGENDDVSLPILECKCGFKFNLWDFIITSDSEEECQNCKRKLYFENTIRVYEIK